MRTRILARAVVYDKDRKMILLVKNKNADYWYIPGGGWESESESILERARREVKEETGLDVKIERFLYLREFHDSPEPVCFESFWLATVAGSAALDDDHVDLDPVGAVESAKWFTRQELEAIAIYPERIRTTFWDNVEDVLSGEDRFIGVESAQ